MAPLRNFPKRSDQEAETKVPKTIGTTFRFEKFFKIFQKFRILKNGNHTQRSRWQLFHFFRNFWQLRSFWIWTVRGRKSAVLGLTMLRRLKIDEFSKFRKFLKISRKIGLPLGGKIRSRRPLYQLFLSVVDPTS